MLLQAFYSIRSERRLMERLDDDLLLRWFVGLGIEFGRQGSGEFRFGAVVAALRCSYGTASMAFTWHGSDEGDEVWAEPDDDGSISREIAFHNSDETTFKARRW